MESSYVSSAYNHGEELKNITDKISRALQDFDDMYDNKAGSEEDSLFHDVCEQVDQLEGGQMKSQLKQFVQGYKEMVAKNQAISEERDEVLSSLADWFSTTSIDTRSAAGDKGSDPSEVSRRNSVIESMTSAKMKFSQLEKLQEEISHCKMRGRGTESLQLEKERLQKEAVQQIKEYKQAQDEFNREEKKLINKAWGKAAEEICSLLTKTRDQGKDFTQELIDKIKDIQEMLQKMHEENIKLEEEVEVKERMAGKFQKENHELTTEKSRLEHKLKRMQAKMKRIQGKAGVDEEEEEKKEKQNKLQIESQLNFQLMNAQEELNKLKNEFFELEETCCRYENQVHDANLRIEDLENARIELTKQLKQYNIKPTAHQNGKDGKFGGNISGTSIKTSSTHVMITSKSDMVCEHCSGKMVPAGNKGSNPGGLYQGDSVPDESLTVAVMKGNGRRASMKVTQHNVGHNRRRSSAQVMMPGVPPTPAAKAALGLTSDDDVVAFDLGQEAQLIKTNQDLQMQLAMEREDNSQLKKEIDIVNQELSYLQDMMSQLEEQTVDVQVPMFTTTFESNDDNDGNEKVIKIQGTSKVDERRRSLHPGTKLSALNVSYDPHEIKSHIALQPQKHEVMAAIDEFICTKEVSFTIIPKVDDLQEKTYCNKGIQTDPRCDPLGAWSTEVKKEAGWRPPMPPAKWLDYDPNHVIMPQEIPGVLGDLHEAMLRGTEPTEVREVAIKVCDYLRKELERMITGIVGYVEMMQCVIDREALSMVNANSRLKRVLDSNELRSLEQRMARPVSCNMRGGASRLNMGMISGSAAPPPTAAAGGRPHMPGCEFAGRESEMDEFAHLRESLLPAQERLKQAVNNLASDSIASLRRTYDVLFTGLQTEHRLYEQIYVSISQRSGGTFPLIDTDSELKVNRSRSISDFENESRTMSRVEGVPLMPRRSTSHASVLERRNSRHPEDQEQAADRHGVNIATATIPKRGAIGITTSPNTTLKTFHMNTDLLAGKSMDTMSQINKSRKVRPVPVSHAKLKQKQKELQKKAVPLTREQLIQRHQVKVKENHAKIQHRMAADYNQAVDGFVGYTMQELEENIDQYVETSVRQNLESNLHRAFHKQRDSLLPTVGDEDKANKPLLSPKSPGKHARSTNYARTPNLPNIHKRI